MRPVLAPIREEPGEGGWIIAVAENVINLFIAEERLIQWYSGEGVGIIVGQDQAM
jgi:hypothetical protein